MGFVTFGEIMLRLTPSVQNEKVVSAKNFNVGYAGSESNVASSLARLGNEVQFVSKLPQNALGDAAMNSINSHGVRTDFLLHGGNKMGTYYIEKGSSIRPSVVIYDRENSSISQIEANELSWLEILKGHHWLHISGITPALSPTCAEETLEAVRTAKKLDVKVSFDLNFRRSLWKDHTEAKKIFDPILECTDLLFANTGALADVYQIAFEHNDPIECSTKAIEEAKRRFGIDCLAFTIRWHDSASRNRLTGLMLSGSELSLSRVYDVEITDRFGTGDAFAAGVLHGISQNWEDQKALDFGTAAFALKHTIPGDQNYSTQKEIESIMNGNISGWAVR
ncbi:sugar kinase [Fulvivirgaceae bacterium BMA10]|uniref:Sugar kinase n=1 Tax=Splendidivirga corallicola TaxID=3051826 RepID=A0ABT8KY53_9BACT|nr:sugar kinase [Fulvivirgaceae bacterium BMA10]